MQRSLSQRLFNDSGRAEKIAEIKHQLESSIDEIIQHQTLLERKLTDQLEEIARRRAELDELEKSSIEEMLAVDKKQRAQIGIAFESVLVGVPQVSNTCACNCAPGFDAPESDPEAQNNIKSSGNGKISNTPYFSLGLPSALTLTFNSPYRSQIEKRRSF